MAGHQEAARHRGVASRRRSTDGGTVRQDDDGFVGQSDRHPDQDLGGAVAQTTGGAWASRQTFPVPMRTHRVVPTLAVEHHQVFGVVVLHGAAFHEGGRRVLRRIPHGATREEPAEDRRLPGDGERADLGGPTVREIGGRNGDRRPCADARFDTRFEMQGERHAGGRGGCGHQGHPPPHVLLRCDLPLAAGCGSLVVRSLPAVAERKSLDRCGGIAKHLRCARPKMRGRRAMPRDRVTAGLRPVVTR